jgi:peptidoglycan hydrolase-like protein with peptidoglycan-binding domain
VGAAVVTLAVLPTPVALATGPQVLGSRTLHLGMRGSDVRTLQTDLTKAGYKSGADGVFGPQTARSVKSFEGHYRLKVDGVAGPGVVRELKAVLAKPSTPPKPATAPVKAVATSLGSRTLQEGMTGSDVSALQQDLTGGGYPTSADDDFGPATKASVIAFQQANNLIANGVFTAAELPVLLKALAAAASAPTGTASINSDGTATAPAGAPAQVVQLIASANQIIAKPYVYGGGHQRWIDSGYDCSGAVSYALHGVNLLSSPLDSTGLESFGSQGPGKWVTIYADASHTFIVVAGRAFDTADYGGPNIPSGTGPRWRTNPTGNLADGGHYVVRHPAGL